MGKDDSLALGIDIGTSAVRCAALDAEGALVARGAQALPPPVAAGARITQDPRLWWTAAEAAIEQTLARLDTHRVAAIAVDGTSGTLLLADAAGAPLTDGWLYADTSCTAEAARIAAIAPADSAAHGAASPLARLLHLQAVVPLARHVLHQADWITGLLCGRFGIADTNNVLKLGHDVRAHRWPHWFGTLGVRSELLPHVVEPGTPIAALQPALAQRWRLRADVIVAAGTTDGVAAFLATGAHAVGDAVSSLGSTLVIKLLSDQPVFAPAYGVYSHRLGDRWLPGGASSSGGAALLRFFDLPRIRALTPQLDPEQDTGLDYYPLPAPGERFPIADATLAPRVTPRPADDARFLQGLLEGLAGIERLAYERLAALGAPRVTRVFSVGGGAANPAWMRLRERRLAPLGVTLATPRHVDAACGAALLARRALNAAR